MGAKRSQALMGAALQQNTMLVFLGRLRPRFGRQMSQGLANQLTTADLQAAGYCCSQHQLPDRSVSVATSWLTQALHPGKDPET